MVGTRPQDRSWPSWASVSRTGAWIRIQGPLPSGLWIHFTQIEFGGLSLLCKEKLSEEIYAMISAL